MPLSRSRRGLIGYGMTTALVLAGMPAALAVDAPPHADSIVQTIEDVAPEALRDVAPIDPTAGEEALGATVAGTDISIPADATDGIAVVTSDGDHVGVGLPFAAAADDALALADGIVSYDNNNGSITVPVTKTDGTVAVNLVLSGPDAPSRYDFPVTVPAGAQLRIAEDGGAVIVAADGMVVAGFAPPWAKGADGAAIETRYEVSGTTLTQVIEHAAATTAYPAVADPWLWIDLVKSVTRVSSPSGIIYQVVPTAYGRFMPEIAIPSGWNEAVKKGVPNRQGLKEQYYCHPLSYVARAKSSWNLDTWRPTVGLARTMTALCNP